MLDHTKPYVEKMH